MSAPSAQPPLPLPPRALVAVLRAPTAERFVSASKVLWDAGVTCFEYTLTSEGALDALVEARQILPDATVGVGTVRTTEHLGVATEAGAAFAVSQVFLPELVAAAKKYQIPYVPGTLKAVAYKAGKQFAVKEVRTAGPAARIKLTPDRTSVDDLSERPDRQRPKLVQRIALILGIGDPLAVALGVPPGTGVGVGVGTAVGEDGGKAVCVGVLGWVAVGS